MQKTDKLLNILIELGNNSMFFVVSKDGIKIKNFKDYLVIEKYAGCLFIAKNNNLFNTSINIKNIYLNVNDALNAFRKAIQNKKEEWNLPRSIRHEL